MTTKTPVTVKDDYRTITRTATVSYDGTIPKLYSDTHIDTDIRFMHLTEQGPQDEIKLYNVLNAIHEANPDAKPTIAFRAKNRFCATYDSDNMVGSYLEIVWDENFQYELKLKYNKA